MEIQRKFVSRPIGNSVLFFEGSDGRTGAVVKDMAVSMGGKVAMRAQGNIANTCICLQGVIPEGKGRKSTSDVASRRVL